MLLLTMASRGFSSSSASTSSPLATASSSPSASTSPPFFFAFYVRMLSHLAVYWKHITSITHAKYDDVLKALAHPKVHLWVRQSSAKAPQLAVYSANGKPNRSRSSRCCKHCMQACNKSQADSTAQALFEYKAYVYLMKLQD